MNPLSTFVYVQALGAYHHVAMVTLTGIAADCVVTNLRSMTCGCPRHALIYVNAFLLQKIPAETSVAVLGVTTGQSILDENRFLMDAVILLTLSLIQIRFSLSSKINIEPVYKWRSSKKINTYLYNFFPNWHHALHLNDNFRSC